MNIAGRLQREGHPTHVRHIAEVLADITDDLPPIGEARG
jgi:L-lactate dehydrogenase complex protein LldE